MGSNALLPEWLHTSFGMILLSLQFYMHAIIGKADFMDSNQSPVAFPQFPLDEVRALLGTSLVVQRLRLCIPNAGGLGSISG